MTKAFKRVDRIAELIQRKLSQLIQQEVKDPRLPTFVTLSAVKLSTDLSQAKVYFTVLNEEDIDTSRSILNASANFLRSALAKTLTVRTVPQLHFVYDESLAYGRKLSNLIAEVNKKDAERAPKEGPAVDPENEPE